MQYNPSLLNSDFLRYLKKLKLSSSTSNFYISDIRVFLRWVYKTTGEYEVNREMFESYENTLRSGLPTKTVNRKLSSLRAFNKYLLSKGYLKYDVMKNIKNTPRTTKNYSPYYSQFSQSVVLLTLFGIIVVLGGIVISQLSRAESEFYIPQQTAGRDIISAGQTEKQIYIEKLTSTNPVFITPVSSLNGTGYYVVTEEGAFTLKLDKPLNKDFFFNWMVVAKDLPLDINSEGK